MAEPDPPFASVAVAAAFDAFPSAQRRTLLRLRALIFEVARATPAVGALEESLKWGQPSYATAETGAGTPLRLGLAKGGGAALFAHCATRVVPDFQALFGEDFGFEGTRAVVLREPDAAAWEALGILVASGLTYHLRRKHGAG